jgi:hypothetical protein
MNCDATSWSNANGANELTTSASDRAQIATIGVARLSASCGLSLFYTAEIAGLEEGGIESRRELVGAQSCVDELLVCLWVFLVESRCHEVEHTASSAVGGEVSALRTELNFVNRRHGGQEAFVAERVAVVEGNLGLRYGNDECEGGGFEEHLGERIWCLGAAMSSWKRMSEVKSFGLLALSLLLLLLLAGSSRYWRSPLFIFVI